MTLYNNAQPNGFAKLGITTELVAAASAAGFDHPKPIQEKAIPAHLAGRDVLAIAQTGSGKTAAFSLPILTKITQLGTRRTPKTARALILAPTRELAVQIEDTIRVLGKGLQVATALVLGGVSRGAQVKRLAPGVDFLIATPGRLVDLMREGDVSLAETRWLVLDEADRMLDMGFINDVRRIAKATHRKRQTALFSATMPDEIAELAKSVMTDPVRVEVAPQGTAAAEITQSVVMARTKQKRRLLADMLSDPAMRSVLVFSRTKHGADRVTRDLERDGFDAAVIHGNKSQNARQKALNGFRDGTMRILVATDIAARGIDVPGISHVVNFDLPDEPESYVHRIGRTGRNGATGTAITLCDPSEGAKLRAVEKVIRNRLPIAADHTREPDPQYPPAPAVPAEQQRPGGRGHAGQGASEGGRGRPQRQAKGENGERRGHRNGGKRFGDKVLGGGKPFGGSFGGAFGGDGERPKGGAASTQPKRRRRFGQRPAHAA